MNGKLQALYCWTRSSIFEIHLEILIHMISWFIHAFWLVLTYDLSGDRRSMEAQMTTYKTNRFILLWFCAVIDHQNVVRMKWHTLLRFKCYFFPLSKFDVNCVQLLTRCIATRNLFINKQNFCTINSANLNHTCSVRKQLHSSAPYHTLSSI